MQSNLEKLTSEQKILFADTIINSHETIFIWQLAQQDRTHRLTCFGRLSGLSQTADARIHRQKQADERTNPRRQSLFHVPSPPSFSGIHLRQLCNSAGRPKPFFESFQLQSEKIGIVSNIIPVFLLFVIVFFYNLPEP